MSARHSIIIKKLDSARKIELSIEIKKKHENNYTECYWQVARCDYVNRKNHLKIMHFYSLFCPLRNSATNCHQFWCKTYFETDSRIITRPRHYYFFSSQSTVKLIRSRFTHNRLRLVRNSQPMLILFYENSNYHIRYY